MQRNNKVFVPIGPMSLLSFSIALPKPFQTLRWENRGGGRATCVSGCVSEQKTPTGILVRCPVTRGSEMFSQIVFRGFAWQNAGKWEHRPVALEEEQLPVIDHQQPESPPRSGELCHTAELGHRSPKKLTLHRPHQGFSQRYLCN